MANDSVLVTGGLGQIGSFIVEELLCHNIFDNIIVLDNLSSNKISEPPKNIELIKLDIREHNDIIDIMHDYQIDAVVHTAAQISVPYSNNSPRVDAMVNISGTLNLLDAAIKNDIDQFITFGSAAVLGEPEYLPIDPNHPRNPISPYGISKATAEQYTINYANVYDVRYNVIRPFNVYSNRILPEDPYAGVISVFKEIAEQDQPFTIEGDGTQIRDFIHASDVAKITLKTLQSKLYGEIINAATGQATTIEELSKYIADIYDVEWKVEYLPPRKGDIHTSLGEKSIFLPEDYLNVREGLDKVFNDPNLVLS